MLLLSVCLLFVGVCSLLFVGCWPLLVGCWLLAVLCWLLLVVVGCCWPPLIAVVVAIAAVDVAASGLCVVCCSLG